MPKAFVIPNKASLEGVEAKIERADKHIKNLNLDISTFLANNPYRILANPEAEGRQVNIFIDGPPVPIGFSILAGEIVYHLRSSLDHLLWQLVIANKGIPTKKHEFPIYKDASEYKEACKRGKIKGVAPVVETLIETLQPYHGTTSPEEDLLWALHDLYIVDKHRVLIDVVALVEADQVRITSAQGYFDAIGGQSPFRRTSVPSKGGAQRLASFEFAAPLTDVGVYGQPAFQVTFGQYIPFDREPVIPSLTQLFNLTNRIVDIFRPYL